MDCYKFELNTKTVKKAARRLWDADVKFRILGTAIVVLALKHNRNKITTIFFNLQVAPVAANTYDITRLFEYKM